MQGGVHTGQGDVDAEAVLLLDIALGLSLCFGEHHLAIRPGLEIQRGGDAVIDDLGGLNDDVIGQRPHILGIDGSFHGLQQGRTGGAVPLLASTVTTTSPGVGLVALASSTPPSAESA
ncbi:hypothetical protein SY89_03529 [Halolamina pelagica]|uniref:Uncharacterized protein n=1 Tax=Halolamina pelagica TaxID=699431 RepID=A0A0P7HQ32_9EURY|nr:hypothetical protein SY89_03529 [Halolamina pelagica]